MLDSSIIQIHSVPLFLQYLTHYTTNDSSEYKTTVSAVHMTFKKQIYLKILWAV